MQTSLNEDFDSALDSVNRSIEEKATLRKAKSSNLGYVNLQKLNINPDFLRIIPEEEARKNECVVFYRIGSRLRVGILDKENIKTQNSLNTLKSKGFEININLISPSSFKDALRQYANVYKEQVKKAQNVIDTKTEHTRIGSLDDLKDLSSAQVVNELFVKAIQFDASDIHIEPREKDCHVRFRVDGILQHVASFDKQQYEEITKQIKHQARLKLNVTTRPQDGRTYFNINQKKVDVRVSSLPSVYGEDIVLRILGNLNKNLTVDDLGLDGHAYKHVKKVLQQPNGLVLITGPTGSGKTTTLYAILRTLNTGNTKIITLEDPIEYKLDGITQSQIDEHQHYDFATGLRSILRQDPDIVMVGEIRDNETAEVAAQAALTGHKVLSTLHTNSAVASISRLHNMGVASYSLAPALEVIIAQRLVRRICPHCSKEIPIPESVKKVIGQTLNDIHQIQSSRFQIPETIVQAGACDNCNETGYKGRIGIFEVLYVDEKVKDHVLQGSAESDILKHAQSQGMLSLFQDGILKVIKGITTLEEVRRVTG